MKVFLSGKIEGDPDYIQKFENWERFLKKVLYPGCIVLNPTKYSWVISQYGIKEYYWMVIKDLCKCDAIAFMPDYFKSDGAMIELSIARYLNIEIIFLENIKLFMREEYEKAKNGEMDENT